MKKVCQVFSAYTTFDTRILLFNLRNELMGEKYSEFSAYI